MCDHHTAGLDRRSLFLGGAGLAAAGAITVVEPALAADRRKTRKIVFEGRFDPPETQDWHYLPFRVPKGVRKIQVSYTHQPISGPISQNVVDIGIFDPSGRDLGDAAGFRGWSGGARDHFFLTRGKATPGYLPGPITPGRWAIILGPYQIVPPGTPYTVVVTLHFGRKGPRFEPSPAPTAVPGTGPGWYRGDLHTHTVHSDGRWRRPQLARAAKAAGLDFIGSAEHNTSSATSTWGRHAPADLLVVSGEEVTTRSGHWVATGLPAGTWIDWRYRAEDDELSRFTDQVDELGGVAIAAHPFNIVPSIRWEHGYDYAGMHAVEVWNGAWTNFANRNPDALAHWHTMLVAGTFLPAVGNSDSHNDGQTVGLAQTICRLETLSTAEVVKAVRGGHCWIAESSAVDLTFTARVGDGEPVSCGDTLAVAPGDLATVTLSVTGVPGSLARVLGPAGVLGLGVADTDGSVTLEVQVPAGAASFVRAEVGRPRVPTDPPDQDTGITAMAALTNPIFLG